MKGKLLRKLCAVSLSALMLAGIGGVHAVPLFGEGLSVSAAENTYGNLAYEVNEDGGITVTKCWGFDTEIIIPDTIDGKKVTKIGDNAFNQREYLTSVTIPDSVTSIGKSAFFCCSRLKSVKISKNVTSIGASAFMYCRELTAIDIPKGVTKIEDSTFYNCFVLSSVTLPDTVTSIGEWAFSSTSMKSITLPANLTTIGYGAFSHCNKLSSITFPASVTNIEGSAFYYCSALTSLTIPATVKSIGKEAFRECLGLTSVTVAGSGTTIGDYAFSDCDSLTSVKIPDKLKNIGEGTFSNCEGLADKNGFVIYRTVLYDYFGSKTDVKIPESITEISGSAFAYQSITSVDIPTSVKGIGRNAFCRCYKLTSITIPDSVTRIGNSAFFECENLTAVEGCSKLAAIRIPTAVNSIGNNAFQGCSSLTTITIPASVTSIGNNAFEDCSALTSYNIPDSVKSIGSSIFKGCKGLADAQGFVIFQNALQSYYGTQETVRVPENVTKIDPDVFSYCHTMKYIVLGSNITEIGTEAFFWCENLTSITIPDGVTELSQEMFFRCYALKSVTIPDTVTFIGDDAFYDCSPTIKGKAGSYAETYAKKHGIPFKVVSFPVANKSTLSSDKVVLGKNVTVNCAAKDGTGPYTYAVYYRKAGTTNWTIVQGYKNNATVTFKPGAAVNYEVRVAVKDANGKIVRKDMTLSVKKPLVNTSQLNLNTIKLGEKVKVRCFAEDGETPYTFSVQYKKSNLTKWSNIAVNSTNNIFVLKPASATTYDIRVTAKSSDGQVAKKTLTLTVTK